MFHGLFLISFCWGNSIIPSAYHFSPGYQLYSCSDPEHPSCFFHPFSSISCFCVLQTDFYALKHKKRCIKLPFYTSFYPFCSVSAQLTAFFCPLPLQPKRSFRHRPELNCSLHDADKNSYRFSLIKRKISVNLFRKINGFATVLESGAVKKYSL